MNLADRVVHFGPYAVHVRTDGKVAVIDSRRSVGDQVVAVRKDWAAACAAAERLWFGRRL